MRALRTEGQSVSSSSTQQEKTLLQSEDKTTATRGMNTNRRLTHYSKGMNGKSFFSPTGQRGNRLDTRLGTRFIGTQMGDWQMQGNMRVVSSD